MYAQFKSVLFKINLQEMFELIKNLWRSVMLGSFGGTFLETVRISALGVGFIFVKSMSLELDGLGSSGPLLIFVRLGFRAIRPSFKASLGLLPKHVFDFRVSIFITEFGGQVSLPGLTVYILIN